MIYFSNKRNNVLLDLHELLFDKDYLSSLLTTKKTVDSEAGKSRAVEQTPTVHGILRIKLDEDLCGKSFLN